MKYNKYVGDSRFSPCCRAEYLLAAGESRWVVLRQERQTGGLTPHSSLRFPLDAASVKNIYRGNASDQENKTVSRGIRFTPRAPLRSPPPAPDTAGGLAPRLVIRPSFSQFFTRHWAAAAAAASSYRITLCAVCRRTPRDSVLFVQEALLPQRDRATRYASKFLVCFSWYVGMYGS